MRTAQSIQLHALNHPQCHETGKTAHHHIIIIIIIIVVVLLLLIIVVVIITIIIIIIPVVLWKEKKIFCVCLCVRA